MNLLGAGREAGTSGGAGGKSGIEAKNHLLQAKNGFTILYTLRFKEREVIRIRGSDWFKHLLAIVFVLVFPALVQIFTTCVNNTWVNKVALGCLSLVLMFFCLVSYTDPGYVTYIEDEQQVEERWCGKCVQRKPARAHHCNKCNRCVRRYDHHCPWINNCIGQWNWTFFMLFLITSSVMGIACLVLFAIALSESSHSGARCRSLSWSWFTICVFVILACVVAVLTFFCVQFLGYWMMGLTTQEFEDLRGRPQLQGKCCICRPQIEIWKWYFSLQKFPGLEHIFAEVPGGKWRFFKRRGPCDVLSER